MVRKITGLGLCVALVMASTPASAQFGGIGKKLLGGGSSESSASSADASAFLDGAFKSTKNVMIAASLLAQALQDRSKLGEQKAQIDAIQSAHDMKELNSHRAALESNLGVLTSQQDLSSSLTSAYQAGNARQKQLISVAMANLLIGTVRNVRLAGQAPGLLSSMGSNPQMLTKMGELKLAASLIGLQGKGLGTIGIALPKVMGALKLKVPANAETTEPAKYEFGG